MDKITYEPIGVIHSYFKQKEDVPIQAALSEESKGQIEVYPQFQLGLKDLEGFSHIIPLYHFHLSKGFSLLNKPFLEEVEHGIFSIRAPKRPNPIGISIVKLEKIENNILYIKDVDIIDGTPLLDIKPYIPQFDAVETPIQTGWMQDNSKSVVDKRSDDRFV